MVIFTYQAVDHKGEIKQGEIEAHDEAHAGLLLQNEGLIPIKIHQGKARFGRLLNLSRGESVKQKDVKLFTIQLSTLIEAGLPLDRALSVLLEIEEKENWRNIISDIQESVRGGKSLSDAFSKHPKAFSHFYVNLVRAGEISGSLDISLNRLAQYLERADELRGNIKKALYYPIILFIAMVGILSYLLLKVVPTFENLLKRRHEALPFLTDMVFGMSYFLRHYWYIVLIVLILFAWWFKNQLNDPVARKHWDGRFLRIPIVGDMISKVEFSRFARTLGTLLSNGVPLLTALRSVRDTVGNSVLSQVIEEGIGQMKGGRGIANALIKSGHFPVMGLQMLRVGEETGKLESSLLKVADLLDGEIRNDVSSFVALLGPLMLIIMGGMVGLIMGGLIQAMLVLSSTH